MISLKNKLWVLPFVAFLGGYLLMSSRIHKREFPAPLLIGKTVSNAIITISDYDLNTRIVAQKEDAELPAGTIVNQTPLPGTKIKPHQTMYLVISRKPNLQKAPHLHDKPLSEIITVCEHRGLTFENYHLSSSRPKNTCIAQLPAPGHDIVDKQLLVYLSAGEQKSIVWPSFKGKTVREVKEFFQGKESEPIFIHAPITIHELLDTCQVIDQRPPAGTLIDHKDSKVTAQFQVS